jgi:hypothetical protein
MVPTNSRRAIALAALLLDQINHEELTAMISIYRTSIQKASLRNILLHTQSTIFQ